MLQPHLSTLFLILTLLGLGLVTLSLTLGKWGLWIGALMSCGVILRWIYFEMTYRSRSGLQPLKTQQILRTLGWHQPTVDYSLSKTKGYWVELEFSAFQKPHLVVSSALWNQTRPEELRMLLFYFCELGRNLNSNRFHRFILVLAQLFGVYLVPRFSRAKDAAITHLHEWHGLNPTEVKIQLQQSRFRNKNEAHNDHTHAYFYSFPNPKSEGGYP